MSKNKPFQDDSTWWEHKYDEPGYIGDYFRKRMETAMAWINHGRKPRQEVSLFDAGCGGGQLAMQAASRGYRVIGMDYSLRMLRSCLSLGQKKSISSSRFFQGNINNIPVEDAALDIVVCLGVLSYLRSEMAALMEFARVLKPGGLLIVSATNRARLVKRLDLPRMILSMEKKIVARKKRTSEADPEKLDDLPQRSYWIRGFYASLRSSGFRVSGLATFPYDLPTLFGREFLPRRASEKVASLVERLDHLPLVESVGSMWMIRARKRCD